MDNLKLYEVEFKGMWSVGNCLILLAPNKERATEIAKETIKHTHVISVDEVPLKEGVVVYLSGDY